MIKFNVMYPYAADARFDHDYYRDKHMTMLAQRMGAACIDYTVEKGIAGGAPGSTPPFIAACAVYAESTESLFAAIGPHIKEITGDVANYTDQKPVIWISEVVKDRR